MCQPSLKQLQENTGIEEKCLKDKLCSWHDKTNWSTSDAPASLKPDAAYDDSHSAISVCHNENRRTAKKKLSFLIPGDEYKIVRKHQRVMRSLCILTAPAVTGAFKF